MRVYHNFFCYPNPDPRFLKEFRIRLNDPNPTGSGSETLIPSFSGFFFTHDFFIISSAQGEIFKLKEHRKSRFKVRYRINKKIMPEIQNYVLTVQQCN